MRTTNKLVSILVVLISNVVHSLGSTEYAKCMSAREIAAGKVFDEETALTSLQGSAYYKIFLPEAAALKVSLYTDHDEDGEALAIFLRHGCDATNDVGIPDTPEVYTKYSLLLEESKTMLQKSGGTNEINGGYYDVGVNSPHLVQSGWWYVRVNFNPTTVNSTIVKSIKYSLSPVIGTDACQKPKYGDLHVCGKYVNFKTLGVQWRHLERAPMVGEGYSNECMEALLQAWCYQLFYKCDENNHGIGIKPCPSACTDIQEQCPKCVIDEKTGIRSECSTSWRDENRDLNQKNCYIFPSKEERALGLHTNFGASSQCYTDEHAPWGKKGKACRQLHFTCETPECYPTARPLFCNDDNEL